MVHGPAHRLQQVSLDPVAVNVMIISLRNFFFTCSLMTWVFIGVACTANTATVSHHAQAQNQSPAKSPSAPMSKYYENGNIAVTFAEPINYQAAIDAITKDSDIRFVMMLVRREALAIGQFSVPAGEETRYIQQLKKLPHVQNAEKNFVKKVVKID